MPIFGRWPINQRPRHEGESKYVNSQAVKPLATIAGFNYSRGKPQTLTLYVAER